jgi:hypothetical protein
VSQMSVKLQGTVTAPGVDRPDRLRVASLCAHDLPMIVSKPLVFSLFLFLIPASLIAHHSFFAEFDERQPVKVTGAISRVEWENPHVWFYLDVKGADGKIATWGFSANAPGQMMRQGVTKDIFKPGIVLTVQGYRAKDGSNNANSQKVTLPDKQSVVTGTSGDAPTDKRKTER